MLIFWILFNLLVVLLLVLDLGVFHRKDHVIGIKESIWWSIIWVGVALIFNVVVYYWRGYGPALEFFTGYLIERSLSIDNLFVFLVIFSYFRVEPKYQYRVLFWGILFALVIRGVFILFGVALISRFHWALYVFGLFLVVTGIKMAFQGDEEIHPESNPIIRVFRKLFPVTKEYRGHDFFVKEGARWLATPLFIVLLVVETTDIVFALDSIPAILGITLDPFIVYSSNVFAILGLRAMYFALAGAMELFHLLKYGLSFILSFIGVKMLIADFFHISTGVALTVVGIMLLVSILLSLVIPPKKKPQN